MFFGLFKKKESISEPSFKKEIVFYDNPLDKKEIMKIEKFDPRFLEGNGYHKMDLGAMSSVAGVIPNVMASALLSKAYRVVMPQGVNGQLMKLQNGLMSTPVIGEGKRIVGHAGLQSLNPAAMMLGAFTVASFFTGQYFMAEINKKLERISSQIDEIKIIITEKIKAEVLSSIEYVRYIKGNVVEIAANQDHRIASLVNVQRVGTVFYENLVFYESMISNVAKSVISENKGSTIDLKVEVSEDYINLWRLCNWGYLVSRVLEIRLSGNYNDTYLKNVVIGISERIKFFNESIVSMTSKLETSIADSKFAGRNIFQTLIGKAFPEYQTKHERHALDLGNTIEKVKMSLLSESNDLRLIKKSVEDLIRQANGEMEFIVYDGAVYSKPIEQPA